VVPQRKIKAGLYIGGKVGKIGSFSRLEKGEKGPNDFFCKYWVVRGLFRSKTPIKKEPGKQSPAILSVAKRGFQGALMT